MRNSNLAESQRTVSDNVAAAYKERDSEYAANSTAWEYRERYPVLELKNATDEILIQLYVKQDAE